MAKLDLIVTHYAEPFQVGKKFFDMLCLQRGIRFSDFNVIVIQDGEDGELDWEQCFRAYPYNIQVRAIEKAGVSAARNAGVRASDAEWVIFCDFDDTFTSIHSIRRFMEAMSDGVDLVYSHLYGEQEEDEGYRLEEYFQNDTFIHGKMFRRQFLIDNDLWFEEGCTFSEDTLFCHVMNIALDRRRVCEIPEKLFTHCWYPGSVCRSFERNFRNAVGLFVARKALIRAYHDRGCMKNYMATVVKTALDYYYAITSGGYPEPEWFERDFWDFWLTYRDVFETAEPDIVAYENDLSFHEATHKGFVRIPSISFWDWIEYIEDKFNPAGSPIPDTHTVHPRIAVYHGTREVYSDMCAAMKSLVKNSSVEKIYLLIEDDEFPYEVPDFAEVINVKDQKYILPSSPNYNCCWKYMVMLRAAFSKIFRDTDVILSLDTDTIVTKNIDDIWNTDLTDAYYAAVKETKSSELYGRVHTNMGVCLLNLKKLREDGMDDRILHELNTVEHAFTEQDVFNEFCAGNVMTLPSQYNASPYTAGTQNEKIIHFAGFREKVSPLIDHYRIAKWPKGVTLKPGTCSVKWSAGMEDEK